MSLSRYRLRSIFYRSVSMPTSAPFSRRSRARTALLTALFTILIFALGINLVIDTVRPDLRDPEYGRRLILLRDLQTEHGSRPLWIALGSSRTQMALNPAVVNWSDAADALGRPRLQGPEPIVFNLGQAGCGPPMQYINLERLLDAGIKPDLILIEVLHAGLASAGPIDPFVRVERLTWADVQRLAPYAEHPVKFRQAWIADRLYPWYAQRHVLMSKTLPRWVPTKLRQDHYWKQIQPTGQMPYPLAEVSVERRAAGVRLAQREYQPTLADFKVGPLGDEMLRRLLTRCRAEGIRTALFATPEGPTFRAWYAPETLPRMNQYLEGLSREFGVPVFLKPIDWFGDEMFADSHHLLPRGADEFTRRLTREFLFPLAEANAIH